MNRHYILDEEHNIITVELMEWAKWYETGDRRVAQEIIGDVRVSTVFLGIDHSFSSLNVGPPILFETMIFGGEHDDYQVRYATRDEAVIGHKEAVAMVEPK